MRKELMKKLFIYILNDIYADIKKVGLKGLDKYDIANHIVINEIINNDAFNKGDKNDKNMQLQR